MLIDNLTSNINNTISFIKTLNLNNRIDSLIMSYVDSIKENLKTQKEKDDFTQFISSLEDKFPNSPYINWNCLRFYKAISSHDKFIVSLKDSDNSEDDENDQGPVYLGDLENMLETLVKHNKNEDVSEAAKGLLARLDDKEASI